MRSLYRSVKFCCAVVFAVGAIASCGGGGGAGSSTPAVQSPVEQTTSSVAELVMDARWTITEGSVDRLILRVEITNRGSARFIGNDSANWAFHNGDNLKNVPTSLFESSDQEINQPFVRNSLSDIEISPGETVEYDTEQTEISELDHATYSTACIEEGGDFNYDTCGPVYQYDAFAGEIYQSGSRRGESLTTTTTEGDIAIDALPGVVGNQFFAAIYIDEACENDCPFTLEENTYQVIAYDPGSTRFAAGPRGDVLNSGKLMEAEIDIFGVPTNNTWNMLVAAAPQSYDSDNAVVALFFGETDPKPRQMVFCVLAGESDEVLECSETFTEGFVGPPFCEEGFAKAGTSAANMAACDELELGQGLSCQAQIVGASLAASTSDYVEVGATVQLQGCSGEGNTVFVGFEGEDNVNSVEGDSCSEDGVLDPTPPENVCRLADTSDGSYSITAIYNQCAVETASGTVAVVSSGDETVASLDVSTFCEGGDGPVDDGTDGGASGGALEILVPCQIPCALYGDTDPDLPFGDTEGVTYDVSSLRFDPRDEAQLYTMYVGLEWYGTACTSNGGTPGAGCVPIARVFDISNGDDETRFGTDTSNMQCEDTFCDLFAEVDGEQVFSAWEMRCGATYGVEIAFSESPGATQESIAGLAVTTPACGN